MKEYNKSSKLEHVAYDIRGPVLEEAMRMRANGEKILRLNTGNPAEFGFTAPDEVIHDLIMNARDSEGYSDSKGIFSARKAIMQYCQLKKFPNVDIDDIYLGNGVSELIVMSMQGLLDNGDEVLVPMPDYPLWTAAVSLAGGNAVHYICDEAAEWYPDIDDIKSRPHGHGWTRAYACGELGTRCLLCQHEWFIKIPPYCWLPCRLDGLVWT